MVFLWFMCDVGLLNQQIVQALFLMMIFSRTCQNWPWFLSVRTWWFSGVLLYRLWVIPKEQLLLAIFISIFLGFKHLLWVPPMLFALFTLEKNSLSSCH